MLLQRVAQPVALNNRAPACKPCAALPSVSRGLFHSLPARNRGSQVAQRLSTKAKDTKAMDIDALRCLPGVAQERDPATDGFVFQQTMYRIRDPKKSLDFYTRIMGLTLLNRLDFPEMKFSLYFLGQYPASEVPLDPRDRTEWTFSRPGTLELTHNWGTESDPNFQGYHNGNSDPGRGFGHIGFAVPDVDAACRRFAKEGVDFSKRPQDGKMKGLAFIKDPDGYLIEIFNAKAGRAFA